MKKKLQPQQKILSLEEYEAKYEGATGGSHDLPHQSSFSSPEVMKDGSVEGNVENNAIHTTPRTKSSIKGRKKPLFTEFGGLKVGDSVKLNMVAVPKDHTAVITSVNRKGLFRVMLKKKNRSTGEI